MDFAHVNMPKAVMRFAASAVVSAAFATPVQAREETLGQAFARALQAAGEAPFDIGEGTSTHLVSVDYEGKLLLMLSAAPGFEKDCLFHIGLDTETAPHTQKLLDSECDGYIDYKIRKGETDLVSTEAGFTGEEYGYLTLYAGIAADSFKALRLIGDMTRAEGWRDEIRETLRGGTALQLDLMNEVRTAATSSLLMSPDVEWNEREFKIATNFGGGDVGQVLSFRTELLFGQTVNCEVVRYGAEIPLELAEDRNCDGSFDIQHLQDPDLNAMRLTPDEVALPILYALFGFAQIANREFPSR